MSTRPRSLELRVGVERFPLKRPFRITRRTVLDCTVLTVTLSREGVVGRGEAAGVYYRDDHAHTAAHQIEAVRPQIEAGIAREAVQTLLPAGGARNALDCARWDLEAKLQGQPVWQLAGLSEPKPLVTTFTISAGTQAEMASCARDYASAKAIKLKLTGEAEDAARVRAVRAARPDAGWP